MEYIGGTTKQAAQRHEGEHGGRARHRGRQACNVRIEPNEAHQQHSFRIARTAIPIQWF